MYGPDERNPLLELCKMDPTRRLNSPGVGVEPKEALKMLTALVQDFDVNLEAKQEIGTKPTKEIGELRELERF